MKGEWEQDCQSLEKNKITLLSGAALEFLHVCFLNSRLNGAKENQVCKYFLLQNINEGMPISNLESQ